MKTKLALLFVTLCLFAAAGFFSARADEPVKENLYKYKKFWVFADINEKGNDTLHINIGGIKICFTIMHSGSIRFVRGSNLMDFIGMPGNFIDMPEEGLEKEWQPGRLDTVKEPSFYDGEFTKQKSSFIVVNRVVMFKNNREFIAISPLFLGAKKITIDELGATQLIGKKQAWDKTGKTLTGADTLFLCMLIYECRYWVNGKEVTNPPIKNVYHMDEDDLPSSRRPVISDREMKGFREEKPEVAKVAKGSAKIALAKITPGRTVFIGGLKLVLEQQEGGKIVFNVEGVDYSNLSLAQVDEDNLSLIKNPSHNYFIPFPSVGAIAQIGNVLIIRAKSGNEFKYLAIRPAKFDDGVLYYQPKFWSTHAVELMAEKIAPTKTK